MISQDRFRILYLFSHNPTEDLRLRRCARFDQNSFALPLRLTEIKWHRISPLIRARVHHALDSQLSLPLPMHPDVPLQPQGHQTAGSPAKPRPSKGPHPYPSSLVQLLSASSRLSHRPLQNPLSPSPLLHAKPRLGMTTSMQLPPHRTSRQS